jgi:hypothetical protein
VAGAAARFFQATGGRGTHSARGAEWNAAEIKGWWGSGGGGRWIRRTEQEGGGGGSDGRARRAADPADGAVIGVFGGGGSGIRLAGSPG